MKKAIHRLFICFPVLLLLAAGCKKENIDATGTYQDAVYFAHRYTDSDIDSTSFSFIAVPADVNVDTVWLPVRVSGLAASKDRAIILAAVDSATNAVAGTDYKLLSYSMPKDSLTARLPVILYRTAALQDTSLKLTLRLQTSADFPVQMKDTSSANGAMKVRNSAKIVFTDRISKPSNWDSFLVYLFGAFSKVKFRFMIEVTGQTSFPISGVGAMTYPQLLYYQGIVRNALTDYNAANGTLYDENGNPVTLP